MKAVVVTGASSGIGFDAARYLDLHGFHVFAGVRSEEDAERMRAMGSDRLQPVFIDVTDSEMIAAAAQEVTQAVGDHGLVGLVNNAGIAVSSPMEFVAIDDLRRQLEINLIGQVAVTQAFLPLLRQAKGRILNISSLSGTMTFPFFGPYAMSKQGLEAFTDALRQELLPWGIEVISIQPGSVVTPIWDKAEQENEERLENFPAQAHKLYGKAIDVMRRRSYRSGENGMPVEVVSQIIYRALTAKRPKTRYFIVKRAWMMRLLRYMPDRLRDRLLQWGIGLPRSV